MCHITNVYTLYLYLTLYIINDNIKQWRSYLKNRDIAHPFSYYELLISYLFNKTYIYNINFNKRKL